MIQKAKDYLIYGGSGVRVCDRWHVYTNYLEDISKLPNFNKKMMYPNIYRLDKDLLQLNIPKSQRIYSKETCTWMSNYDNIIIEGMERNFSGFYGVSIRKNKYGDINGYYTVIQNIIYGRYKDPILAANLFNYIYHLTKGPFNDIDFKNNVPYIVPLHVLLQENCMRDKSVLYDLLKIPYQK